MKKSSIGSLRDWAHEISYHPQERVEIFCALPIGNQIELFPLLSPHVQQTLLEKLKVQDLVRLINHVDLGQAERILARIKNTKRRKALSVRIKKELREKAEYFLRFSPKAEFNLLNFNYILLSAGSTISDAADALDMHVKETGHVPEILVHKEGVFVGEVVLGDLVRERNTSKIGKFVKKIEVIHYSESVEKVREVLQKTRRKKIALLDGDESVVGIIYADDVARLFRHGPAEALYDFAGVSDSEKSGDSVLTKVEYRYRWLLINLGTAFLAAWVVSLFENTINEFVLLAVYMPIVAGMGGNAATQTLAVMVRGIAMGEVDIHTIRKPLLREVGAGMLNGFIVGVVVAFVASFINHSPLFGLVVAVSMVVNLIVAGFFGALIPVVMKSLGKDPATSATIFITTATDVFGFFTFLGLATLLLV